MPYDFLPYVSVREAIGLAASFLICASLCMAHIKSLRAVNLTGSLMFIAYGVLIRSPSIIILNAFSAWVNIYYLVKIQNETNKKTLFDVMFASPGDDLVRRFVLFHAGDICRFFPSFNPDPDEGSLKDAECCFILRETLPVSLVAFKRGAGGEITIVLDYAVPAYRDFKNAKFFFNSVISRLSTPGTVLLATGEVSAHANYLHKIGFTETEREGPIVHFKRVV
jgi:hypothetical protein